jgi:hypothetical protein
MRFKRRIFFASSFATITLGLTLYAYAKGASHLCAKQLYSITKNPYIKSFKEFSGFKNGSQSEIIAQYHAFSGMILRLSIYTHRKVEMLPMQI